MSLSTTQQLILDKAKEGHSLLILGQSGTGKSHLFKEIAHELLRDGKSVVSLNVGGQTTPILSLRPPSPPKKTKQNIINLS